MSDYMNCPCCGYKAHKVNIEKPVLAWQEKLAAKDATIAELKLRIKAKDAIIAHSVAADQKQEMVLVEQDATIDELRALLEESRETIKDLADQQAMADDFYLAVLNKIATALADKKENDETEH